MIIPADMAAAVGVYASMIEEPPRGDFQCCGTQARSSSSSRVRSIVAGLLQAAGGAEGIGAA